MAGRKEELHMFRLIGFMLLLVLTVPVVLMTAIFIAPILLVAMPIFIAWSIQEGGAAERHHDDAIPIPVPLRAR